MTRGGILPQDIVTDILTRVPVKSLCRFKCVSPSWNSLISDPHFAKTHLNRTNTQNPKTSLIHTSHNLYSVNFADVDPTATKLDFPMVEQHATPDNQVIVLSACNGLLLVSHEHSFREGENLILNPANSQGVPLFLLNPANRECKKLPTIPFVLNPVGGFAAFLYGAGYDPFTDDYKVVMLCPRSSTEPNSSAGTIIVVYSQKTNAWRRIQDSHHIILEIYCGVFLNGCLHCRCWSGDSFKYVAFDLSDEVFREVPLPAYLDDSLDDTYYRLKVLGDCLCLVFRQRSDQVGVWMRKEHGIRESWTKLTIDMPGMSTVQLLCSLGENEYLLKANRVTRGRDYGQRAIGCIRFEKRNNEEHDDLWHSN